MLSQCNSKEQEAFDRNQKDKLKAKSLGDWDSRIARADPNPEMITNSHYWEGYCQGMYRRYLEKYGINRSN